MHTLHINKTPETLEKDTLYINDIDLALILLCPCGCGAKIILNLDPSLSPNYTVFEEGSIGPTLYPAVSRVLGCHSRFSIKRGVVEML